MKTLANKLFPSPVAMIQFDHMHVLSTYHQFHPDTRPSVKEGLVKTVCTAIEIHAQLEEEIFYPAVREATTDEFITMTVGALVSGAVLATWLGCHGQRRS